MHLSIIHVYCFFLFWSFSRAVKLFSRSRERTVRLNLSNKKNDEIELLGAIKPMQVVIESQFKIGKEVTYGIFQQDVDPGKVPSQEERWQFREQATQGLFNIGLKERERRALVGKLGVVATSLLLVVMSFYHVPLQNKCLGLYFPLALTYGFLESAREGL